MLHSPVQQCNSTIFGYEGDKYSGSKALYLGRPVDPEHDIGIAHRGLPLGSLVVLHVPKRDTFVVAVVIDRGPYGRIDKDGNWYNGASEWKAHVRRNKPYSPGSRWNGCIDITPRAAELLEHDGWEVVQAYPLEGSHLPRSYLLQIWGGNV
jgi:hypothetical protein